MSRLAGYAFALAAGTLWGMTGPLSTAIYAEGAQLTDVGFWRVLLSTLGLAAYGLFNRDIFRVDLRALLLVFGIGGVLVALFEVGFQYAIAGAGVASAVAMLYVAPVLVALLARPLLGERLTLLRLAIAAVVMVGVALTVNGHIAPEGAVETVASRTSKVAGIIGGLLAAVSFAGTTLLARFAVPRYGSVKVLFLEIAGGTFVLWLLLPLSGHAPLPPATMAGWVYIAALGICAVLLANFAFFAAVDRIEAAPASVGASIEPVVGALLALFFFGQGLTLFGWLGLLLVVGGVAGGYLREAAEESTAARTGEAAVTAGR